MTAIGEPVGELHGSAALRLVGDIARFAQELRAAHGLEFAVRMGLNSGEVVVGKIGDDLRMDYTAMGHTVGLAARLQAIAAPGQIVVSDQTAALVAGLFETEAIGGVEIGANDDVRDAGLVLEREEDKAFRGARPLAGDHHPGGADPPSRALARQLERRNHASHREPGRWRRHFIHRPLWGFLRGLPCGAAHRRRGLGC